jgi:transposase-like protein
MLLILPEITTLVQYLFVKTTPAIFNNVIKCTNCGCRNLWKHGHYYRKADRDNPANQSLNPIPIQRFLCLSCKKTCSVLPECIPPKRWYSWVVQQIVFALCLIGKSIYDISTKYLPSRHTISRWINRFQQQFELHKSILLQYFVDLGRTKDFTEFWLRCFKNISLGHAMRLCNAAEINIP